MKKIIAMLCLLALLISLTACSSPEDELVGKWYIERNDVLYFTFYSDGTCKVHGKYGTGKWSVTDGVLKLVDFYGQTTTFDYTVKGDVLTINANGNVTEMYRK